MSFTNRLYFAVPGDIASRTGGYIYDRRLIDELRRMGWQVEHLEWPASFPFPSPADENSVARSIASCPDRSLVLIDGLAYGVLPGLMAAQSQRLNLIALCHHPLALETGLSASLAQRLRSSEQRALRAARAVIVTSATTADNLIHDYAVAPERIAVARPGVDRPAEVTAKKTNTIPHLLSIGTITPRKNHAILVEALSAIADLNWRCTIAGSLTRAPETAAALHDQIERLGLRGRIALLGEIDDAGWLYSDADIFVLPSRHEGYGMVLAEALVHGVPIVATHVGAIPEVVPESAGILVPANDTKALSEVLRRLIGDGRERESLAAGAFAASQLLDSWSDTAASVAAVLHRLQRAIE